MADRPASEPREGNNNTLICCFDPAFVDHLHHGSRKDSSQQCIELYPILQWPQKYKKLFAQMDFLEYLLCDAYSYHITALERFSITNGYIRN
jgi:hypothetical protein